MKPGGNGPVTGGLWRRILFGNVVLKAQWPGVVLAIICACGESVAGERSAAEQLDRMADAMRSLSYEGTLVYLHNNRLETLHIEHRIEHGQPRERLVSLNGPSRTMTREHDRVTCELSDSHSISVDGRGRAQDMLRSKAIDPETLSARYLIHPLGEARVAGRQTDVVGIIPRDNLRYGYRFYLDVETGLPLKSDLMGEGAEPIEQIMFTSLRFLASEDVGVVHAAVETGQDTDVSRTVAEDAGIWRFADMPVGFELVMHDHLRDGIGHPTEHFVLSDGLASVSIYVELDAADGLDGATRIGAIHAVGGRISGHQVTVVGEVPALTVQTVLANIRYQGDERP